MAYHNNNNNNNKQLMAQLMSAELYLRFVVADIACQLYDVARFIIFFSMAYYVPPVVRCSLQRPESHCIASFTKLSVNLSTLKYAYTHTRRGLSRLFVTCAI